MSPLQVGAVTETVEVTGAAARLQTDSSEHGQVINTQAVVELPLNGRNYSDLALLATNVHRSPLAANAVHAARRRVQRQRHAQHLQQLPAGRHGQQRLLAPATRDSPTRWRSPRRTPWPNSRSSPATSAPSTGASAAPWSTSSCAPAPISSTARPTNSSATPSSTPSATSSAAPGHLPEADPAAQSVRRHRRRPDRQEQALLLCRLRRLPPTAEGSELRYPAQPHRSRRHPARTRWSIRSPESSTPPNTPIPDDAVSPRKVLNDLPAPNGAGTLQQLPAAPADPRLLRQVRRQDRRPDQRQDDRASCASASARTISSTSPTIAGPSGGDGNGFVRIPQQAASAGYTWTVTPTSLLEVRLGFTHISPARAAVSGRRQHAGSLRRPRPAHLRRISPAA